MNTKPKIITGVIREEDPIPKEMERLRQDSLGRPIPYFVDDPTGIGDPDFRIMSSPRWYSCVKNRVCWVCGGRMGSRMAIIGGPIILISGFTYDPPAHLSCSEWSMRNCPFLVNPMRRLRESNIPLDTSQFTYSSKENPGVGALVQVREAEFVRQRDDEIIRGLHFTNVDFYERGTAASDDRVMEVFDQQWRRFRSDNPNLPDEAFIDYLERALPWLPREYRDPGFET